MKVKAFIMSADGKEYGPYPHKHKPKVAHLEHKKGITVKAVWAQEGEVKATTPPAKRAKKDRSTPLLDGTGFIPVPRNSMMHHNRNKP